MNTQIYLSWHFLLWLRWSGCSQYRCIYLGTFCYTYNGLCVHNTDLFISALFVMLRLVWVFTLQFIYLGIFCYAYNALGVHNKNLFILTLSVMLTLVWVFIIQIYSSWHFLLWLRWSGCSQCIFIYLDTFCYACVGMDVENTCVRIL